MARPLKPIDPRQVELLAGCGCTIDEIAAKLGVDDRTIERRFDAELRTGRMASRASLRGKQFEVAMKGNVEMLKWCGKQLLGQHDKIDVSIHNVSDEELETEVRRRIALAAGTVAGGEAKG